MEATKTVSVNTDALLLPEDAIKATRAAQLLRTHVCVIHRWVNKGKLPGWRVGTGLHRRLWVSLADVKGMVGRAETTNGAPKPHAQTEQRLLREFTARELAKSGLTPEGKRIPRARG